MNSKDKKAIQNLAQEGKQLSKIQEQDFPEYDYGDIYAAVHESGGQSARGAKKTISMRLQKLIQTRSKPDRSEIIEEISDLVEHLYDSVKSNQKKLDGIRKILDR